MRRRRQAFTVTGLAILIIIGTGASAKSKVASDLMEFQRLENQWFPVLQSAVASKDFRNYDRFINSFTTPDYSEHYLDGTHSQSKKQAIKTF